MPHEILESETATLHFEWFTKSIEKLKIQTGKMLTNFKEEIKYWTNTYIEI